MGPVETTVRENMRVDLLDPESVEEKHPSHALLATLTGIFAAYSDATGECTFRLPTEIAQDFENAARAVFEAYDTARTELEQSNER